jgi:hypothetical protein
VHDLTPLPKFPVAEVTYIASLDTSSVQTINTSVHQKSTYTIKESNLLPAYLSPTSPSLILTPAANAKLLYGAHQDYDVTRTWLYYRKEKRKIYMAYLLCYEKHGAGVPRAKLLLSNRIYSCQAESLSRLLEKTMNDVARVLGELYYWKNLAGAVTDVCEIDAKGVGDDVTPAVVEDELPRCDAGV